MESNRSNSLNRSSLMRFQNDYRQEELFRVQKKLFQHPNITFNRKLTDSFKGLSDIENTFKANSHQLIVCENSNRVFENPYLFSPGCKCFEILLVDDVPFNLMALVAILERHKLKIDTAYSGMEALYKIQNFKKSEACECRNFRIVIIDIEMPGMNGVETTLKILEYAEQQGLTIWVFGNSGHGEESEKHRCLKVGMSGYFTKPIDVEIFLNLLKQLTKPTPDKEKK